MSVEGKIVVDLGADGAVALRSTRPADLGRMFQGKTPEAVTTLLPLLFSLCGGAHLACARQALGQATDKDTRRRDALEVLAENAREHLLRIALGWGKGTLPLPRIMALVPDMRQAAGDSAAEQDFAGRLADLLQDHVFGASPEAFLSLQALDDLMAYLEAARTMAAGHILSICAMKQQALGAIDLNGLPNLPLDLLRARLTEPGFTQCPDWQGVPCETGPLARQSEHPLIRAVLARHGAGLLARQLARLVDLAQIPAQIRSLAPPAPAQIGIGIVETARGRLVHAGSIADGRVASYRILAPTEWNFCPEGAAVQAIRAISHSTRREEQAKTLIAAIDPCVEYEVRIA